MRVIQDKKRKYCFVMDMEVRDYELDCEQIVNNANYLHYMEHTRHKFCEDAGMSFIEMHKRGIDAVVRKIEMTYRQPLRGGERFISCLSVEKKGPCFVFHQDILKSNGEIAVEAIVTIAIINDGKLSRGEELMQVFAPYL